MITIDRETRSKEPPRNRLRLSNNNVNFVKAEPQVDRANDIIRGYSVITAGEALGHGYWIDDSFLDRVVEEGNAAGQLGVKSRYTHPGLSSDGMGKQLGRAKNFRRKGSQVLADIHFIQAAHTGPEGDLAGHVMDLAEQDPQIFATSIVYTPDMESEKAFRLENTDETGNYRSPDKRNKKNLPHARLSTLHASDIVDDPAANPGGFFSSGLDELPTMAEGFLDYIFQDGPEPDGYLGDIHPGRIKNFVKEYCNRNQIVTYCNEIGQSSEGEENENMSEPTTQTPEAPKTQGAATEENRFSFGDLTLSELRENRPDLLEKIQTDASKQAALSATEEERSRCLGLIEESSHFPQAERLGKLGSCLFTALGKAVKDGAPGKEALADIKMSYSEALLNEGPMPSVNGGTENNSDSLAPKKGQQITREQAEKRARAAKELSKSEGISYTEALHRINEGS